MHLVGLGLQPGKEALRAVPDAFVPIAFTLDDPLATFRAELPPRCIDRDAPLLGELDQIVLTFFIGLRLPGLDSAAPERLAFIRNDEAVVDADGATETAAALTGANGRVE